MLKLLGHSLEISVWTNILIQADFDILWTSKFLHARQPCHLDTPVAPLNVKTTLNVKTAKCEKPNNR